MTRQTTIVWGDFTASYEAHELETIKQLIARWDAATGDERKRLASEIALIHELKARLDAKEVTDG